MVLESSALQAATTRAGYAVPLTRLVEVAGPAKPAADLTPKHYATVMDHWSTAASATWNRHLSALTFFTTWVKRQKILTTNPARRLGRRKITRRGDRSVPRTRQETLLRDDRNGLLERVRGGCSIARITAEAAPAARHRTR